MSAEMAPEPGRAARLGGADRGAPRLSVEDRGFLDEFGRQISIAAGSAGLVGGLGFYGLARQGLKCSVPCLRRHLGRRRGLWTAMGATVWPA